MKVAGRDGWRFTPRTTRRSLVSRISSSEQNWLTTGKKFFVFEKAHEACPYHASRVRVPNRGCRRVWGKSNCAAHHRAGPDLNSERLFVDRLGLPLKFFHNRRDRSCRGGKLRKSPRRDQAHTQGTNASSARVGRVLFPAAAEREGSSAMRILAVQLRRPQLICLCLLLRESPETRGYLPHGAH